MSDVAVLREQNALLAEQLRIKDARIDDLLNDQREARIARNTAEARNRELEIELCGATARLDILLDDLREARQAADTAQQTIRALINDLREARREADVRIDSLIAEYREERKHLMNALGDKLDSLLAVRRTMEIQSEQHRRSMEIQSEQHHQAIMTQAEQHRRAIETQSEHHREERKRMVNVFGGKLDSLLVAHEQSRSQIMQKLTTMDSRMTKRPIHPGKKHGFALLMTPLEEPDRFELRFIAGQADYVATTTSEYPDDQILFPFTETGNPIDLRNNFRQLATERLVERLGGSTLTDMCLPGQEAQASNIVFRCCRSEWNNAETDRYLPI